MSIKNYAQAFMLKAVIAVTKHNFSLLYSEVDNLLGFGRLASSYRL